MSDGEPAQGPSSEKASRWTSRDDIILLDALAQQRNLGHNRDALWTPEAWAAVVEALEGTELISGGARKTVQQCKARWQRLKIEFRMVKHLRSQPCFSWDERTQMLAASPADWEIYIGEHKEAQPWRRKSFPAYDRMQLLLEDSEGHADFVHPWSVGPVVQLDPSLLAIPPPAKGVFPMEAPSTNGAPNSAPTNGVHVPQPEASASQSSGKRKEPPVRSRQNATSKRWRMTLSTNTQPNVIEPPSPPPSLPPPPQPTRMTAAIQVAEQNEGLPDDDFVKVVQMFQRRQDSADAYLAIQSQRARSLYLRAELEDFARTRPG